MNVSRLSDDTLATVLLCSSLGNKGDAAPPLTQKEWNGLVRSLIRANWRPGDLIRWEIAAAAEALLLDADTASRIDALTAQAVPVATELERLAGAGIGVMSRADEAYPSRWRSRLRDQCPPLVFFAGPLGLLEHGGVAAVGSREVDEAGASFARALGRAAARARAPIISGGARGVDREAMFGSLESGGEAVGVMPDGLSRALRSPDVRRWVADGQLTLVSPHRPNARFEVWKAMSRNKLIYALADVSVVISSDVGRGGTWAGATENLKHDWSPLFARSDADIPEGNRKLVELGAMPVDCQDLDAASSGEIVELLLDRAAERADHRSFQSTQQALLNGDHLETPHGATARRGTECDDNGAGLSTAAAPGQLGLF